MFRNVIESATIEGIVASCPTQMFENADYAERFGEKYVKKNVRMTGVERFRICRDEQTASDLCYVAAEELLSNLGWSRDEVGALVFVTQFPDYQSPSTAFVLQKRLGVGSSCVAFDVNLGCSGYVVGLQIVASLLKGSNRTKGLLLCGDTGSKNINHDNRATALLFGDAGSATAITVDGPSNFDCAQMSKGESFKSIINPRSGYRYFGNNPNWVDGVDRERGYVGLSDSTMNGDEVFQFTITDVANLFRNYFNVSETAPSDYDYFVFHQAQKFILDNLAAFCDLPGDKVLSSLRDFGNTSVASIPLTLCLHRDEIAASQKARLFMSGFGIGLSYGVVCTSVSTDAIGKIMYTDEFYEDWL